MPGTIADRGRMEPPAGGQIPYRQTRAGSEGRKDAAGRAAGATPASGLPAREPGLGGRPDGGPERRMVRF